MKNSSYRIISNSKGDGKEEGEEEGSKTKIEKWWQRFRKTEKRGRKSKKQQQQQNQSHQIIRAASSTTGSMLITSGASGSSVGKMLKQQALQVLSRPVNILKLFDNKSSSNGKNIISPRNRSDSSNDSGTPAQKEDEEEENDDSDTDTDTDDDTLEYYNDNDIDISDIIELNPILQNIDSTTTTYCTAAGADSSYYSFRNNNATILQTMVISEEQQSPLSPPPRSSSPLRSSTCSALSSAKRQILQIQDPAQNQQKQHKQSNDQKICCNNKYDDEKRTEMCNDERIVKDVQNTKKCSSTMMFTLRNKFFLLKMMMICGRSSTCGGKYTPNDVISTESSTTAAKPYPATKTVVLVPQQSFECILLFTTTTTIPKSKQQQLRIRNTRKSSFADLDGKLMNLPYSSPYTSSPPQSTSHANNNLKESKKEVVDAASFETDDVLETSSSSSPFSSQPSLLSCERSSCSCCSCCSSNQEKKKLSLIPSSLNMFDENRRWPQAPLALTPTPSSNTRVTAIRFSGGSDGNDIESNSSRRDNLLLWEPNSSNSHVTWSENLAKYFGRRQKLQQQQEQNNNVPTFCDRYVVLPINNGNEKLGESLIVDFESDLFVGSLLLRLKDTTGATLQRYSYNNDVDDHHASSTNEEKKGYFDTINGNNDTMHNGERTRGGKNRRYQAIIRGKFKRTIPVTELVTGLRFERKLTNLPSKWILKSGIKVLSYFAPQLDATNLLDNHNDNVATTSLLSPLGSTAQSIIVDDDIITPIPTHDDDDDDDDNGKKTRTGDDVDQQNKKRRQRGRKRKDFNYYLPPLDSIPMHEPSEAHRSVVGKSFNNSSSSNNNDSKGSIHQSTSSSCSSLLLQRSKMRKKVFDQLYVDKSKEIKTDPSKVYTFEFLQHMINYQDFTIELFGSSSGSKSSKTMMNIGGGYSKKIHLRDVLDGQPLQIMACHGDVPLWSFDIWHECLIEKKYKNQTNY